MKAGELWSLSDPPIVVCLTGGQATADTLHAVIVHADADSGEEVGADVLVRPRELSQRWTVKPLTGVAREVTT